MPVIEVKDVRFAYPDGTVGLDGVSLVIERGEFIALIGQNGSGKTTLSKCMCGLLRPTAGQVIVDGIDVSKKGIVKEIVKKVGYVFQNPDHQIFNTTVYDEIGYGPYNLGLPEGMRDEVIREAASVAGVHENLFGEHPFFLPKGLRQRVAIASILALRPEVIIVDEPTTGQDIRQSLEVMGFLKKLWQERGHAIVIVTHEMAIVAAYAHRTIVMCDGKILLDGPTREVFTKPEVLMKTYVRPPQVCRLAQAWADLGVRPDVLTVQELADSMAEVLAAKRGIASQVEPTSSGPE